MLRRVALVRTDVSEERSASIIRVTRIGELGTTLAVTSNLFPRCVSRLLVTASVVPCSPILVTLTNEALRSSETSVLTRPTRRNTPEDSILHSHCRENLRSYIPYAVPFSPFVQYAQPISSSLISSCHAICALHVTLLRDNLVLLSGTVPSRLSTSKLRSC
jgi:hypothetical protein